MEQEVENRVIKRELETIEYTERTMSPQSVVLLIFVLTLFFFSVFFYIRNEEPILLVIIVLCLQTFFKFIDNIPTRIWKLYPKNKD